MVIIILILLGLSLGFYKRRKAPGNFDSLVKLIKKGIPLPLSMIKNRKIFVFIENLVDAIVACIKNENAKRIYLLSDAEIIFTPDLIWLIAKKLKKRPRLCPLQSFLLKIFFTCFGKSQFLNKILSSLTIDCNKIRREISCTTPFALQIGIEKSVEMDQATYAI